GPGDAEGVLELAVDVAPELGLERGGDFAAGGDGAVPPHLGVVDMDVEVEALGGHGGVAIVGKEVADKDGTAVDVDLGVDQPVAAFGWHGLAFDAAKGDLVEIERLT